MKRMVVLIGSVVIIMMVLVSCANTGKESLEPPVDTEQKLDSGAVDDAKYESVYDMAFASFLPDTVMIQAGDLDVTWAELFVSMRSMVGRLSEHYGDEPIDWLGPWDDDRTVAEWLLQYVKGSVLSAKALEYGAKLHGIALSEEDWAVIREENNRLEADWGGEEAFLKMIWEENGFYSLALYEYMKSFNRLSELLLSKLYGEEMERVPDEDVEEFIAGNGFIMAKHIVLFKPEYGGSEDVLERIEEIQIKLGTYIGEDFDAYFDELMSTYSEDVEGYETYPQGFLFLYGDLTQYFYEAAVSLEINETSEIVEGEDGYHIIYRIPINYDVVPFSLYQQQDYRTLRMLTALEKFELLLAGWLDMLAPEFTDAFESIDIREMFKRA